MTIWWAVPIFVALVGVLLVVGGVGRMFKLKFVAGGLRSVFGLLCLALAGVAGLIGLNLQTYAQLSKETLAGRVTIKQTGEYQYIATVDIADKGTLRGKPQDYPVTGEIIFVSGPVLTFKPWANVIGMDSMYTLTRVRTEYVDVDCTNLYHPETFDTGEDATKNAGFMTVGSVGESWKMLNVVDAIHYSASGQRMADGAVYDLWATQDAFVLKPNPENDVAKGLQNEVVNARGARCEPVSRMVQTPAYGTQPAASPSPAATPQP